MVLQDAAGSLNPRQTVYESVAEGIRLHRLASSDSEGRTEAELVAAALSEAGLRPPERLFLRYPHELSGGQKQRVLIAGALALRPELLIADEPVSSLDASIRGEILALLLKLREELGLGVVVVTHDLGLAWNIADRIAVMYLGRVVECGTTEEVLRDPQHPYTQALLSVVPEIEQLEPVVLTGEIPDPTRIPPAAASTRAAPRSPTAAADAAGVADDCRRTAAPEVLARAEVGHRRRLPPRWRPDESSRAVSLQAALPREMYVDDAAWARRARAGAVREWYCVGRLDDLGLDAPGRLAVCRRGRRVGAGHERRRRRAARGVQRLPAPRLPAGPARAGLRAGLLGGRGAALPVPLVDLRAGRPAAEGAAHRRSSDIDPADFALHPVGVEDVGGLRLRAPHAGRREPLADGVAQRRGQRWRNYGMGALVTGLTLTLRRRGQLQGAARELQRVLPLRPGAPRAGPAGAVVRGRWHGPRLGGRHPAPRGRVDVHDDRHHEPGAACPG